MQNLIAAFADHLWQSTAFAAVVALACLALRNHSPRLRYWLWMAASLKFLVPFALLVSIGARVERPPTAAPILSAVAVEHVSSAFSPASLPMASLGREPTPARWPAAMLALWGVGFLITLGWRIRQWLTLQSLYRRANPLSLPYPLRAFETDSRIEPGVFGAIRPVLLLPRGLRGNLTEEQFDALIAHELCHVRYRDNLTAAAHMVIEALFWFHPPVWWIGTKLVAERERACDESVLARGGSAEAYASGILSVCKCYLKSPLACAPGITGSELKKRVREIMTGPRSRPLSVVRKTILAACGVVRLCVPVAIGVLQSQTVPPPPEYTYEVASVRPSAPGDGFTRIGPGPQGGMQTQNTSVMQLLTFAYDVPESLFADIPGWVKSEHYDVTFTPDHQETAPAPGMPRDQMEGLFNRQRQRMQAVLRDRFGLVLRSETRQMPLYALTIAKGGSKLTPSAQESKGPRIMRSGRGQLTATSASLKMLAQVLASMLGRQVVNETGLDGSFDINLQWAPDPSMQPPGGAARPAEPAAADAGGGASIFTALTEQLGLKLESRKGPAPVLVIEKIQKPEQN